MINKEPVISIKNIDHYYGRGSLKKQILFDISLEVYAGEIVIMTGPSGSGKTTLLSLIGGLRSVQEGSLKFLGEELCGASQSKLVQMRRKIGYIFQAHNLLGFLTARQNVQMAVELNHHISQSTAISQSEDMLTSVGLQERTNYYPDNLSGGQKQRVAIARALVNHPPLVLADEPTAALDKQSGRDVVEIMQRLAKDQGTAILLVTHDNRILDIADRIVEMEDGLLTRDAQNVPANRKS
ncbi:DevA family ABC transporter ATP-binding protein [Aphanizomenon flos-aquae NRERC-008]|jgi:putative ABC transport system ATP-binding protein|uniref:ABC transporter n=3 Tax=Aphanizomenon flos-aquae TaxID=1176 RepID=A0A1B7X634_APHFL|nr:MULTISPECIES: DevA family ABC transporter ATP-binding protein [Aphanizomenon]MBD1216430.1 DevA family ABC transporter ATP-binding protein [Aphanizomenon flos-aquae Clear-A1]MBD2390334.1 DevA family ABC transporter ATP-binding protein [Aphanizomenon flos-aquae FACHB-1171]MBD2555617.1 DevA family ABC transporter ATP-binding protein [Aphanizomenon flos-aquae FACHB-1290]MBD2631385.1 DevA family ABC transporter ATP-binding protein [Aphanizomenon sp. FACHB-1399]MBD2655697.1 DevA family ABC transp